MHLSSWLGQMVSIPFDEDQFLELLDQKRQHSRKKTGSGAVLDTEGSY